jgi:hypothetical protein
LRGSLSMISASANPSTNGEQSTCTRVSLFAADPWPGFDRSQLVAQCALLNDSIIDGLFARGLDLLSKGNSHGVCFESLSLLGYLASAADRGTLGTCITDLADVDAGTLAHAACTLIRLNPNIDVCLGIGVRHNAPDQTERVAQMPDRLGTLLSHIDELRHIVPFDISRLSIGLVGSRVAQRVRTHALDLFRRCASVYVPVGALAQWGDEYGVLCHGFAAVALSNAPDFVDDVGFAAWRVHENRFAEHMQRAMSDGRFGMLIHTISLSQNRAAWLAALRRLQRFALSPGGRVGHLHMPGASKQASSIVP